MAIEGIRDYRYIDPQTIRKDAIVRDRLTYIDEFPLFSAVEFNIWQNCNRACAFCPVSDPEVYERRNEGIDPCSYRKVMEELAQIDYRGCVYFSGFCEPLLHPNVLDLVSLTKEILPYSRLEIFTNGDRIKHDEGLLDELFRRGLDSISISIYDGPDAMIHFQKIIASHRSLMGKVILRRRFFLDGNWGMTVSNRTGLVDSNAFRDEKETKIRPPIMAPCFYPFYQIFIDYTGRVLICPNDWGKRFVCGNVGTTHILDIWKGDRLQTARQILADGERLFVPCSQCDIKGDLIGGDSFRAWKKRFCEKECADNRG